MIKIFKLCDIKVGDIVICKNNNIGFTCGEEDPLKFVFSNGVYFFLDSSYNNELLNIKNDIYNIIKVCRWNNINFDLIYEREDFIPYLSDIRGQNHGYIGEKTNQEAIRLTPLLVGDVVEVYDIKRRQNLGHHYVVSDNILRYYVMGFKEIIFENGYDFKNTLQIRKIKNYEGLIQNEVYDNIFAKINK